MAEPKPAALEAPGAPGAPPSWGPGRKQGFGTSAGSRAKVWITLADGNLSDTFYPRLDQPLLHELRFIVAAPGYDPVDDAREADHSVRCPQPGVPVYEVFSSHHEYHLTKRFLPGVDVDAVLIAGNFNPELPDLRLFVQVTPHQDPFGPRNRAEVIDAVSPVLAATAGANHIAVVGPFERGTAGYKQVSDIHVQLHDGEGELSETYIAAGPGNVSLGAELALHAGPFQVAVGFGVTRADAEEAARDMLRRGESATRAELEQGWYRAVDIPPRIPQVSGDGGNLARASIAVLRSLEDKTRPGAFVAAPGAPWGERCHDGDHVYHLVWPRDLYQSATALMALGDMAAGARALGHLASMQRPDGSWPQNWDLAGRVHWKGVELDEVAYPVLLAWRLKAAGLLEFDAWNSLARAAALFLIRIGPATPLDRWEDGGGLSPSTIAVSVAALVCAADLASTSGDHVAAAHLLDVADYWADRVEAWCFSASLGGYVRLGVDPDAGPGPDAVASADFLELVRLGIRRPDHPAVLASLALVDRLLLYRTPVGPAWRRYAGDRYGEQPDGSPWGGGKNGVGRPWPLLTGERGMYELSRGGPAAAAPLARALEGFAGPGLMLPEQVWDAEAIPEASLRPGSATNGIAPLGWAHAEYIKLLAGIADARSHDLIEPVRKRYHEEPPEEPAFIWSRAHQINTFVHGRTVKIQLEAPALIRWSADDWATSKESQTYETGLGLHIAELPTQIMRPGAVMAWTIHYPAPGVPAESADSVGSGGRWEGRNYTLTCR